MALGDYTARQGPILVSSLVAAMLGVALSLAFGRVCWEIFGLAVVVLAFGAVVGRRPS